MDQLEKIFIGLVGIILLGFILHTGYFAWFHPDELQIILIQDAQRRSSWPFPKEAFVDFYRKYGILMTRITTILFALMFLIIGLLFILGYFP